METLTNRQAHDNTVDMASLQDTWFYYNYSNSGRETQDTISPKITTFSRIRWKKGWKKNKESNK